MNRNQFEAQLHRCFAEPIEVAHNLVYLSRLSQDESQQHTNTVFSDKWQRYEQSEEKDRLFNFQKEWYLELYGFGTEDALRSFLSDKSVLFDAGCGLGYKAAWLAQLAPHALVIGMDFSNAASQAADSYAEIPNLFFVQGDIADSYLVTGCVDYTSCDQVIMHTENPEATFSELARVTSKSHGELACYFYARKALPRELLDDYFRSYCTKMTRSELWVMSEQLTELGRRLASLNISFECPEIPALGIKEGRIDIQRFVYWNFLKCFWNEDLGVETSIVTNFDWYGPSNARRFSEGDVRGIVAANRMIEVFFHVEQACYSGRFRHLT